MFPISFIIPESVGKEMTILLKLYKHPKLDDGLEDGITISFSNGFNRTNDSNLLQDGRNGWSVHEGKTIHQYNDHWTKPIFTVQQRAGLECDDKPRYSGQHKEFYDSYRLVFRDIARSTDVRSVISTIIPPKTFYVNTLFSFIIKHNEKLVLDKHYIYHISYLLGILNSTVFDYCARQIAQTHIPPIIKKIPIPLKNKKEIEKLAAQLTVGHSDFTELAEKMRISNKVLSISEKIDTTAKLDVLVAKSYGLNKSEYKFILESFKLFKENPELKNEKEIIWNNKNIKEFYGEMRKKALDIFDEV